ncbi:MAG: helix-turn-helix domain-containing protein [Deltaproteobacteria bacterium]|nr:helix-turn-helix domain-containing protein [Deltaproteobacteria bacterium]
MSPSELPELLTLSQVCDVLKLKKQTCYNQLAKRHFILPYLKINGRIRVKKSDLLAYIDALEVRG